MTVTNAWVGAVDSSSFWVRGKVSGSSVRLAVSTAPDLSSPVWFGPTAPTSTGVASIRATGLTPDTQHYWAFEEDGVLATAMSGKARTFVAPNAPKSFTFWAASCAGNNISTGTSSGGVSNSMSFEELRRFDPLFGIHMGDLHYRNIGTDSPALFRQAFDDVLAQPRQGALYRNVPLAYTWDDHDYGANNAPESSPSRPAATAVYRERVPHYDLPSSDGAIYQTWVCGRCRFISLDLRSKRAGATTLGAEQKAWLIDTVRAAQEAVIFLDVKIPWIASDEPDSWSDFAAERLEVAQALVGTGKSSRIIMLAGDTHSVAIDDGRNNVYAELYRPLFQFASLDSQPAPRGGPFSHGQIQGAWQYGIVDVVDTGGDTITVTGTARRTTASTTSDVLMTLTVTMPVPPPDPVSSSGIEEYVAGAWQACGLEQYQAGAWSTASLTEVP